MTMTTSWEWDDPPNGDPELVRVMFLPISQYVFLGSHQQFLLRETPIEADWAMRYPDKRKRQQAKTVEMFRAGGYKVKDGLNKDAE